jgi:hypothetical protein
MFSDKAGTVNLIEQGYSLDTEVVFNIVFGQGDAKYHAKRTWYLHELQINEEDLKNYTDWDKFVEVVLEERLENWVFNNIIQRGWVDVLSSEDEEGDEGNGEGKTD